MSSDQEEYTTRVFKSGNSAAVRLPKGLGIPEGTEVRMVRETPMSFRVETIKPLGAKIDISGFAGKLPGFKPAPREDFEERPSAIARRKALSGE
jgi:antitoxin VapB